MKPIPDAKSIAAFLLGVALLLGAAEAPLLVLVGPEASLHDRVNGVRSQHKLLPLAGSAELARVARLHAEDMAQNGFLDHTNLAGQSPLDRVQQAGIEGFRLLAENIGASTISGDRIEAIVQSWRGSELHNENLLNPAFNTSGIGVAASPGGGTIVVQLYATFPRRP